jgi:hypothetical protein
MGGVEQRRALVLALVLGAMLAAAACSSSGNEPQAKTQTRPRLVTAAPPAAPKTFLSTRYGFRVTLSKGWSEEDAHVDWDGKMLQGIASPAFANFSDPSAGRTLVAAAAPVTEAMTLAEWRAAMVRAAPSVCSDAASSRRTTLGGDQALTWTSTCSDGYDVIELAALHGKRGYEIFLASNSANDNAADRRIFESIRQSFRFTR